MFILDSTKLAYCGIWDSYIIMNIPIDRVMPRWRVLQLETIANTDAHGRSAQFTMRQSPGPVTIRP